MSDFLDTTELLEISEPAKRVALIAHDNRKIDLVAWATFHWETLARFSLVATRHTARLLERKVGLLVEELLPGLEGGDSQIAARVATREIDAVFFLADPMSARLHEPDIRPLLRVCNVQNVPLATNLATADMIIEAFARVGERRTSVIRSQR
jgi:methylglyoxal synthase